MHELLINYTKALGKKVLVGNRELILKSISLDHLLCMNGSPEPIPVAIDECKIICSSREEALEKGLKLDTVVVKVGENYEPGYLVETDWQKEKAVINAACNDSGIPVEMLTVKTRKRAVVNARQIVLSVRHLLLDLSQSEAGLPYKKDHATVLHSVKTVKNLLDTDKVFQRRYRRTFLVIKSKFKNAELHFNLNYLNQ